MIQKELFDKDLFNTDFLASDTSHKRQREPYFDFKGIKASEGIYGIHPYPAMFHYRVVRELIKNFSNDNSIVFDPFLGSGVSAVESIISRRNFIGYDINPLGVLISKVRTTPIPTRELLETLNFIVQNFDNQAAEKPSFTNIDYWFNESVAKSLSKIKKTILQIQDRVRDFFLVAFSETVRKVSLTDHNEYKLLKDSSKIVEDVNVIKTFNEISQRNIKLLTDFYRTNEVSGKIISIQVRNILDGLDFDYPADLIITSPPYGDSRTTVAYGQFSRLSLQWIGINENIDKKSLGGKISKIHTNLPSETLYTTLKEILKVDERRAVEIFSFYEDLYNAIKVIAKSVKRGGYVCFVVGNRRVRKVDLPTDIISAEFFINEGLEHIKTIVRKIHNKRIPIQNSPSNIKGNTDTTMR
ncbi:MAG: site-specific DNA-methyltransferase [Spirochaetes bacterium]|nr:site-specific DNA-methyltransferase [Spirochaetota bacterium]